MLDGKTVLIPNADVLTSSVVNYSDGSQRRIEVAAGVSYDSDLDLVRQTTVNVINDIAGVLQDPAPEVVFNNLGPSTVDFTVYYWIDTEQTSVVQAKDAGVRTIKTTFEQASIEMPYPTQTVVLRQE
jgi:small conductance mechanosensitive channel